jgi:hypothetical protein
LAYIDQTYYDSTYLGVPIPADTFPRLSERASDIIDQMTGYKIDDLSTMGTFIEKQVKKATASQTEYLFTQGGETANHSTGEITSANIGNFRYTEQGNGANQSISREAQRTSPAVIGYLKVSGLLYAGVDVR